MMGGEQGEDFVFRSSDSEDADWERLGNQQCRQLLKKKKRNPFCLSSTSSNSSTPSSSHADSLDDSLIDPNQISFITEAQNHLPSKKRTVSETVSSNNSLHSKRNCPNPHLLMGNGFRHERIGNSSSNSGDPNPDSSKSSDMSWQNKHPDKNHHTLPNLASSSNNQPSGSSQDTSSRQTRYHNRPARRNLILSSDSDDDNDWTERTSDNTTFQSHSNSPEHAVSQQKSKRLSNNPQRKSKAGYLARPGREPPNNNVSSVAQPSASQSNKESGASNGVTHHNHRLKRTTPAATGVSGAPVRSSNEDEGHSQPPGQQTPKNRHLHRLRVHQNRPSVSSSTSYAGGSESETFPSNLPFRRDDPGRRAFSRSGHPLHGRRSQGSPHHHRSPLLRGQESPFSSLLRRNPDLFESESTDDGSELFPGGTNSLTRNSFRQSSPPHHRNSFQYQSFGSPSQPENEQNNSEEADEPSVIFVPDNRVSPITRNRRRDQGRFTGASGGRRRRSSRPSHLLSGERSLLSSSPDPVAQVHQMEEDERLARLLQAEFDAEVSHHRHSDIGGHIYHSESDVDVLVDEEETLSSLSSSSSNAEDTSYGGRHRQHRAQYFIRHQNNLGGSSLSGGGPSDAPTRGRRRGSRPSTSLPPVAPQRHWHGSPVRGRRGRTRTSPNADPLMLQFGRWLGWAIIRNLDTEEDDYEVLWNLAESMGEAIPRGLQRHEINRLPTHKYQPAAGATDSTSVAGSSSSSSSNNNHVNKSTAFTEATRECRVCLCDYEPNELLRVLPCFHEFHAVCIDKWLKNNNTCPVCRAEIALDS